MSDAPYTVVVPVGPGEGEPARTADLLDRVRAHSDLGLPHVVLVDDALAPRRLADLWPGSVVVRTELWRGRVPDGLSAMVAGTLAALRCARGAFAIKLDTDALVIAPFARAIASAFARDSSLGVVGAYDRSPSGGQRDFSVWATAVRRSGWPARLMPAIAPGAHRRPRLVTPGALLHVREVLRCARANPGYVTGAHCLGGAYAVSAELFGRASRWDAGAWTGAGLGEDVVLGLYCAAAGLRMGGLVSEGEPFAVAWQGLPFSPEEIVRRRHSIVHSVKDGEYGSERQLRDWFRQQTMNDRR